MDARFRSNLEMIGRNEPITKKAKFWQSYVRALKGSDDIKAPEHTHRPRGILRSEFPELHSWNPFGKSIYDDPIHAHDRIQTPGYRYLPVHREIYGYSPRQLYPHQYKPVERFIPAREWNAPKAWEDHLNRLADHDRLSSRVLPRGPIITSPLLARRSLPLTTKPVFDIHGNILDEPLPLYPMSVIRGTRPLSDLFEPSPSSPISSIVRDPWWHPQLAPYIPSYAQNSKTLPFYLRDSYLSPVKRNYLWSRHPLRPFASEPPSSSFFYYSQPVPVYHFTSPWYNK
ncbi:uncharacterized protein LOC106648929 isoform X1 [Trichogramma pretiosum]|uniref:uncharacterized protein LOC106648929 isoform X1 n=1 Tax=Trichogramma pretiosum TaxID=7493 RepID=UPI0006C9DFDF|nr:uncharacterized protein LOC106648929 isoform X1 [Trichogramma pretiosum]XP_014221586.1 uncharacterized protein LOC106648929 isoform X1 [Trichogramma pretiosum]XP_014221587.1 uncharacterized protein LOC106648929 isoform X1 [Trichogramma pretiosum]